MNFFKKLFYYLEKTFVGGVGNGVSYEKNEYIKSKGSDLENYISEIAMFSGFKVYRNLYIPYKSYGNTKYTEIDVLIVKDNCIYVIESKNYNAKIKGDLRDKNLFAQYKNGKTFNFYNPLIQNETHIWALSNYLNINKGEINSIIVFSDDSDLTSIRSSNIINVGKLEDYLKHNKVSKISNRINLDKHLYDLLNNNNNSLVKYSHLRDINNKK